MYCTYSAGTDSLSLEKRDPEGKKANFDLLKIPRPGEFTVIQTLLKGDILMKKCVRLLV
jgi:hypothetical protein